ncbi:hypothetical protein [Roseivivax marinus]|uniref:hypothetical protein n=1 Tax=Roseivivax marinus TaxID=1379903 RepID=UPI00273DEAFF|nr:hypothetical protein [Roseivivax marinus]
MSDPEMHLDVADAVKRARNRGRERARAILDADEMLTTEEIAGRMQVPVEGVEDMYLRSQLLAISGNGFGLRFSRWQLDDAGMPLEGLSEVIAILGQGRRFYRLLAGGSVGGRPAWQRLADGNSDRVLQQARTEATGGYT